MLKHSVCLSEILVCQKCKSKYDEPCLLPCGETICSSCCKTVDTSNLNNSFNQIECMFCNENHVIPENGFIKNKLISKLLQIKSNEFSVENDLERLEKNLEKINVYNDQIESSTKNPIDLIKIHCTMLISEVNEAKERAIIEINNINKDIIQEIEKCKNNSLNNLEINMKKLVDMKPKMNNLYKNLSELLKRTRIDEEVLIDAIKESETCKNVFKKELNYFQQTILNEKMPYFKSNQNLNSEILGSLIYEPIKEYLCFHDLEKFEIKQNSQIESFCILENGNYFASYPDLNLKYNQILMVFSLWNSNGYLIKKIKTNFCSSFIMSSENAIFHISDTFEKKYVFEIINQDLNVEHSIEEGPLKYLEKIGSTKKNIFLLFCDDTLNTFIHVYDWNLNLIKKINEINYLNFYTKDLGIYNSFRVTDSHLILRFGKEIFILNQSDFKLARRFFIYSSQSVIKTTQFQIGIYNDLIILDDEAQILMFFDFDGELIKEIKLIDFPKDLVLDKHPTYGLFLIDNQKNCVYKYIR